MTSILMVILSGSFLKSVMLSKAWKLDLIYLTYTNKVACIRVAWRLLFILWRNRKRRISAGIGEEKIYSIFRMGIVRVPRIINHSIRFLGSMCFHILGMKCTLLTATLLPIRTWIIWYRKFSPILLPEISVPGVLCVRLLLGIELISWR